MQPATAASAPPPLLSLLANAADRLDGFPEEAENVARDILLSVPGQQHALALLASARKARGDWAGARSILEAMAAERSNLAAVHYELGALLAEAGDVQAAIPALSRVVELEPQHPAAWRLLGDAFADAGNMDAAAKAYIRYIAGAVAELKMLEMAAAFGPEQFELAEQLLQEFLKTYPTDVAAAHALGKLCIQYLPDHAEKIFAQVVELAPDFTPALDDYLNLLQNVSKWEEELQVIERTLQRYPNAPEYRFRKARVLSLIGDHAGSLGIYESLVQELPDNPGYWSSYGHELRTVGRREDCIAAMRKSIALDPGHGQGWWGLAALKTYRFSAAEIDAMREQLQRPDLANEPRFCLHYALGEALEHERKFEESFGSYSRANALRRVGLSHDAERHSEIVRRIKAQYSRAFYKRHAGRGCQSQAPIFILGLPRSGTTLVEQILSCHSAIEGLGELPCFPTVANRFDAIETVDGFDISDADLKSSGELYLERCKAYRKLGRPFFTDKSPGNFHFLGQICAMLPMAKIIDVRRHPLACCFSNFKQFFPLGQPQTYDLSDVGRYYRDYVDLMAHFDAVLPGRIHRVIYEDLVADPEAQIRALLAYCGVPFEDACLRFHQTDRTVRTISSEQVRQPIYSDANGQWRHYEAWLEPLKIALGPVLDAYPAAPDGFER
ncbi:MAG TPA: sulfotransferase [Rhizomicrobium sp.]|nr:sulfotransferase [Rhizomicrobium sp.]